MATGVGRLRVEIKTVVNRVGALTPAYLDGLRVELEGGVKSAIDGLAQVIVLDPTTLSVVPYDASVRSVPFLHNHCSCHCPWLIPYWESLPYVHFISAYEAHWEGTLRIVSQLDAKHSGRWLHHLGHTAVSYLAFFELLVAPASRLIFDPMRTLGWQSKPVKCWRRKLGKSVNRLGAWSGTRAKR